MKVIIISILDCLLFVYNVFLFAKIKDGRMVGILTISQQHLFNVICQILSIVSAQLLNKVCHLYYKKCKMTEGRQFTWLTTHVLHFKADVEMDSIVYCSDKAQIKGIIQSCGTTERPSFFETTDKYLMLCHADILQRVYNVDLLARSLDVLSIFPMSSFWNARCSQFLWISLYFINYFHCMMNRIGWVMGGVLAPNVVDHWFEPLSDQIIKLTFTASLHIRYH